MQLKPQDFLVALKLVALSGQRWTYAALAHALGLSTSEAHACVKRGLQAGLLAVNALEAAVHGAVAAHEPGAIYRLARRTRLSASELTQVAGTDNPARANPRNLAEFAVHGAKYAFPAEKLGLTLGVPTSHSAPAFAGVFAPGSDAMVWPHAEGAVRGIGLRPLHPSVPYAAMQDGQLYEMLALFDALRAGRARERGMAAQRLSALIHPTQEATHG